MKHRLSCMRRIDTLILYGIYVTCAVLPLSIFKTLEDPFLDPKNFILQLIVPVLLAFSIFKIIVFHKNRLNYLRKRFDLFIPLSILLIISVFSLFQARNPYIGLESIFRYGVYIGGYFLVLNLGNSHIKNRSVVVLVNVVIFSALASILAGYLIKFYFIDDLGLSFTKHIYERISTFGNPNFVSHYFVLVIPLGLSMVFYSKNRYLKIVYSLIFIYFICFFIMLRTFGGWISLFFSALLVFGYLLYLKREQIKSRFTLKKGSRNLIYTLIFSVLIVVMIFTPTTEIFKEMDWPFFNFNLYTNNLMRSVRGELKETFEIKEGSSAAFRINLWKSSLKMASDKPLSGYGIGNFQFDYLHYQPWRNLKASQYNLFIPTKRVHNEFIQSWIELGVIGLLIFLFILYRIIKSCLSALGNQINKELKIVQIGLSVSILGIVIYSLFSFPLQMPTSGFHFWLFLGFTEALNKRDTHNLSEKEKSQNLNSVKLIFILLILFIGVLFFSIITINQAYASFYYRKGLESLKEEKYTTAIEEFNQSLKKRNFNYATHYYKGEALLALDNVSEALNSFNHSIKYCNYHLSHFKLAKIYIARNDYNKSVEELENCLLSYPYFEEAYNLLGFIYLEMNSLFKADQCFKQAQWITRRSENAHLGLALINLRRNKLLEAKNEFFSVLEIN
ncbi:MAG: O-antigen ligase family protein, partial [Promethearchaeota archaeon]